MLKNKKKWIMIVSIAMIWIGYMVVSFAKYHMEESLVAGKISIDKQPPKVIVQYSTLEVTKEPVMVTLHLEEEVKPVAGWEYRKQENSMQKVYEQNTKETFQIEDLSGNTTLVEIQITNIIENVPSIQIQQIENSNTIYPMYANQEAQIRIDLLMTSKAPIQKQLTKENIQIYIQENISQTAQLEITMQENMAVCYIQNIQEEGKLTIQIPKGSVQDSLGGENEACQLETNIQIDNTAPTAKVTTQRIENGIVEVQIEPSETIQELSDWEKGEQWYSKQFQSNVSYELPVIDLAGNQTMVSITITQAEKVQLRYASHNSEVGWTYGYGNGDIAGKEAIEKNPKYKTEGIAFGISGNVEMDFLQARAYVHTYWGEGGIARCADTKAIYYHGYNPSIDRWASMLSASSLLKDGNYYFQFGGADINRAGNTDINGKNPITFPSKNNLPFGVSGIQLTLKDTSEYSVVYQIYVEESGWLAPCKNGELTMYQKDRPMSAIRVSLIPNSEVPFLLTSWGKDTANKVK